MKNSKVMGSILISIVLILVLPLISAYGTEEDLKYKLHSSGECDIAIKNSAGVLKVYDVKVNVWSVNNVIRKKFDGTPALPAPAEYNNYGANNCQPYGLDFNKLYFWDLVKYGAIEGAVDYCPDSNIIDPINNGVADLKCNQLCEPNKAVCISVGTLKRCSIDGKEILTETCVYGCDERLILNACRTPENNLVVTTDQTTYSLGEDVKVTGTFVSAGNPVPGITVIAQLVKTGVISELQGVTDSAGKVNFIFPKVSTSGETTVKLTVPNYLGRSYEGTKIIQITGTSIVYEVATYSYTQYSSKNITFTVRMKDSKGVEITPAQITNLHAVITLTQGKVYSGDVTYQGFGLYEISSHVDGSGSFVGKLAFNFEGLPQSSPIITIDIRPMSVSIDTSGIAPSAYLGDLKEYTIKTFDSTGEKLDPDNILIKVSLPDGTTVKNIPFTEIVRADLGVYKFSYNFTMVEKHTFNFFTDYKNYSRGSAKASVAVSSSSEDFGPGIGIAFGNLPYFLYAGIAIVVIYIIYKRRKK